jgi:hypothetical protein
LTHLLQDYPNQSGWGDLTGFLLDPMVAPSKKIKPLSEILRRPDTVPPSVHRRLARWVRKEVRYAQIPIDPPEAFRGLVLRLRFFYKGRSAEALLADLLTLATDESRAARHEAAKSLAFSLSLVPRDTVLTLGLTLSQDSAWEVRAAAASALARMAGTQDDPLTRLAWERVRATLLDPGAVVPSWVLNSLANDVTVEVPAQIRSVINELSERHLSASVRAAASLFSDARSGSTTSAREAPQGPS